MKKVYRLVKSELRSLGNSKKKIRESLKKNKIKGIPEDERSCPLANFLNKKVKKDIIKMISKEFPFEEGDNLGIRVAGTVVIFKEDKEHDVDMSISIPMNKECMKFIDDFDSNKYPELIKK